MREKFESDKEITHEETPKETPHVNKDALIQKLELKGITVKDNFIKYLNRLSEVAQREAERQGWDDDKKREVESRLLVFIYNYLLSANKHAKNKNTSVFTGVHSIRRVVSFFKQILNEGGENPTLASSRKEIRELMRKLGADVTRFTSIYSRINIPKETCSIFIERFLRLKQFAEDNEISFSSISSIFHQKGIPEDIESVVKNLEDLYEFSKENEIPFSSISSIFNGKGIPEDAVGNLNELLSGLSDFEIIDTETAFLVYKNALKKVKTHKRALELTIGVVRKTEEYISSLTNTIENLPNTNKKLVVSYIIKLLFAEHVGIIGKGELDEIINYANGKAKEFIDTCLACHSIFKEEGVDIPDDDDELYKLLAERFNANVFAIMLMIKINNKRVDGIRSILKYGEFREPLNAFSLDDDRNKRTPHEVIGDTDPGANQLEFKMTIEGILSIIQDEISEQERKILEALASGKDVSEEEYEIIAGLFKKHPKLLDELL